jgi:hypothetical protein
MSSYVLPIIAGLLWQLKRTITKRINIMVLLGILNVIFLYLSTLFSYNRMYSEDAISVGIFNVTFAPFVCLAGLICMHLIRASLPDSHRNTWRIFAGVGLVILCVARLFLPSYNICFPVVILLGYAARFFIIRLDRKEISMLNILFRVTACYVIPGLSILAILGSCILPPPESYLRHHAEEELLADFSQQEKNDDCVLVSYQISEIEHLGDEWAVTYFCESNQECFLYYMIFNRFGGYKNAMRLRQRSSQKDDEISEVH